MVSSLRLSPLCLSLLSLSHNVYAQSAGSISQVGSTVVSAMMMFLGSEDKVYIIDKVEGNPTQINGHPAYASEWDINSNSARPMDTITNSFCASWVTFGGNGAIAPGGNIGSTVGPTGTGFYDQTYKDFDGEKAIRLLNPCKSGDADSQCVWNDNSTFMSQRRWYSAAESLADGSVVIVGGFVNGGFINRNYPNTDPAYEGGAADPTYEFYPAREGYTPQVMQFMIDTSGLNSYAHLYLMPSGKMLAQANYSTILWDYNKNVETKLPDMPGKVVRVYPASGAVAMLPLTPANNYTPTILFCGGTVIEDQDWGNYSWPVINTWEVPASKDCQRLTPEPLDGSTPAYEQDDDLLEGRTMGEFVALPDGTLLIINGGANGTAGYATQTGTTLSYSEMPFGMSLASDPVLTPAIYNPNAPKGSRWSNAGFQASTIPRLYHSTAILLPDASVLIAGSNPNVDTNTSTTYPTEYRAERFYPTYFNKTRPSPSGIPSILSYGGNGFTVTLEKASYTTDANTAASKTNVVLVRPGFVTHAYHMGQRMLQLNNTYSVSDNGTITLHVSQPPPNPNILTPGPVLLFVVVDGVPSNGTMVIVGNGKVGTQTTNAATVLPSSVNATNAATGSGGNSSTGSGSGSGSSNNDPSGAESLRVGGLLGGVLLLAALTVQLA